MDGIIKESGELSQFAETLVLTKAVTLLEATLNEEKAVDKKLTELAVSAVNVEASELELESRR